VEWLEVRIIVQNECLSIKSRIEALDGDWQPLVNERCFAAVTGDVADSSAEVFEKLVCRLIYRAKRLHGSYYCKTWIHTAHCRLSNSLITSEGLLWENRNFPKTVKNRDAVGMSRKRIGSEFHVIGPATVSARRPYVIRRCDGTAIINSYTIRRLACATFTIN